MKYTTGQDVFCLHHHEDQIHIKVFNLYLWWAVTLFAVKRLIDMETPNTLQESKCMFHQVVLRSQHILPLRVLGVSMSKNSHWVGFGVGLLPGVLLISPVVRSAKTKNENHSRVWAFLSQHLWTVCPVERSVVLTSPWPLTPDVLPPALCCLLCPAYLSVCPSHSETASGPQHCFWQRCFKSEWTGARIQDKQRTKNG